jgi:hypothetical protein
LNRHARGVISNDSRVLEKSGKGPKNYKGPNILKKLVCSNNTVYDENDILEDKTQKNSHTLLNINCQLIIFKVNNGLVGRGIKIGLFPLDLGLKKWLWFSYIKIYSFFS